MRINTQAIPRLAHLRNSTCIQQFPRRMATSIPATISAVVVQPDKSVKVERVPAPKLESPEDVIIKVYANGQNPTDSKGIAMGRTQPGRITGTDLAGVIAAVGSNVTNVKLGDRVASVSFGSFLEDGTGGFAEYTRVPAGRTIRFPESISFNEAASIGVASITSVAALYEIFKFPRPPAAPSGTPILIWSGATSIGLIGIQLAVLSGLEVITTASPRNFDLLKSLGAKHVFDYNSPTVVEDIKRVTNGQLQYLYDCISYSGSTAKAVQSLAPSGGKVATVLPVDPATLDKKVEIKNIAVFKMTGKTFTFGGREFPATKQDKEFYEKMCGVLSDLYLAGKIKPNPIRVMGGWDKLAEGFKFMEEGKVHGEKLIYEVIKE